MERKELTVANSVTFGDTIITTISRLRSDCRYDKREQFLSGSIRPVSVIVNSPSFKKAFRISGEEITLDLLMQEFPDIAAIPEIMRL